MHVIQFRCDLPVRLVFTCASTAQFAIAIFQVLSEFLYEVGLGCCFEAQGSDSFPNDIRPIRHVRFL
jgi:hypothetical protein